MIEVIEHGDRFIKDNKPREDECDNCHCKFTYTREDCWWDRPCTTYKLKCPECGHDVWLGDVFD